MIAFLRNNLVMIGLVGSLALAAVSGFFASQALGLGGAAPSTRTVTINLANGPTGPAGPAGAEGPPGPPGPAGPAGGFSCPTGFSEGTLVINTPSGHTNLYTCIAE